MTQSTDIIRRFHDGDVIFDGGLGTMLITRGLQPGMPPEEWNQTQPAKVKAVHAEYLKAGADVIATNTFGGTPARVKSFGLGEPAAQLNNKAIRLAVDAVDEFINARIRADEPEDPTASPMIALSLGPTGKMLPPVGGATEDDISREFEAQLAGIELSADLILIETFFDIRESLIALKEAKSVFPGPVAVTMTFNKNPRGFFTVMGNEACEMMKTLEDAGADMVGANCTLTSGDILTLASLLRASTDLPIICQPNAGQPSIRNDMPVYDQTPLEYADDMIRVLDVGVNAVGGCCGTTPEFIYEVFCRRRDRGIRSINTKEHS
ncbi:MAG: homocysteine S-methyltransferase family protein [Candidatus Latescibacterota bacterium]|nr:MAG: homocysteine S-methyltransferase family protein [Candidatus Latescibacterota bacterium]